MTRLSVVLRIFISSLLFIQLSPTYTISQSENPWVGVWNSSYGPMTLSETNGIISGNYHRPNGEIGFISNGIASGNQLTGRWREPTTYAPPYDEGDFIFTLSDDKLSFTGKWRYDQGSFWFGWIGTKGYSINGKVEMYNGSPFAGCEVQLVQNNQIVKRMNTNSSGTFSFLNIQPGTYQVEPFNLDYKFNPESRTVTLENKSIAGIDFKVANTFYISILYSGTSISYEQEIDLTVEIKDANNNYISEQHSIQFSEINAHLGSFTPSNGLVTTTNGKATIKYKAPTKTQAGALGRLLIQAEDKNIISAENYTILEIPFDLEVWAEPKDPAIAWRSKVAIIPADNNFPALIQAKCVDNSDNPLANVPIKFSLDVNSPGNLVQSGQSGKSITVNTDDKGIAAVYYHYLGSYTGTKITDEVTIVNMNDKRTGVVKVEIGLGLEIYKKERYQEQTGIIVSGSAQNLALYVRSIFHPQLELKSYSVNASIAAWSGKEIGVKLSVEWVNKPKPGTWDKFFTQPEDGVYKGRCSMDRLGAKNILYALDNPSDVISNHSFPQVIPKSEGGHIYKISADFIEAYSAALGQETVMVNYPMLGFEVDREISDLENFMCALAPSTNLQLYGAEGVKIFLALKMCENVAWLGDIITISDIVCKVMQGDNIGAIKSIANYLGGKYIDAKSNEFDKLWWLKETNKSEYKKIIAALWIKTGVDWDQRIDSWFKLKAEQVEGQSRLNKSNAYLDNVNKIEYQDMVNQYIISFFAGAQIENFRVVTVFNASESKVTDNTGKEAVLIDKEYSNLGIMMYYSDGNAYSYLLDVTSTFNLEFTTDKNFAVSICDPLKAAYSLYNVPSSQLVKGKLVINNSTNPLQLDYGDNGSIDENKNPEIVTPGNNSSTPNKYTYTQRWSAKNQGTVRIAQFSPDGKKILTAGSNDYKMKVWDSNNGNMLWSSSHSGNLYSCYFNNDGSKIVSTSTNTLNVWNSSNGSLDWFVNQNILGNSNFSYDGSKVASTGWYLTLRSASNGNIIWEKQSSIGFGGKVIFSPDDRKVVCKSEFEVYVFESAIGNLLWSYASKKGITDFNFTSDGNKFLSCDYDSTLKVWNSNNGTKLLEIKHPAQVIWGLFSLDDGKIITTTFKGGTPAATVNLWDANTGSLVWKVSEILSVKSIRFSPDGKEILYSSGDSIRVRSSKDGSLIWTAWHFEVGPVDYNSDASRIVSGSTFTNDIIVWEKSSTNIGIESLTIRPVDFHLFQNYPNPFNPVTTIRYHIAVGSHVTLKVFDILGREVTTLVDKFLNPGIHNSQFSIRNSELPSGVYFYQLSAGNFVETKKLVILK